MRVAEPLDREDVRVEALGAKIGDDVVSQARGEVDIVIYPGPL
jgi:hypothetical protein